METEKNIIVVEVTQEESQCMPNLDQNKKYLF